MRKLNCGLIVSDFDGTLIDDNQTILPKVKQAIDEYVSNGGIFAVCTGRMLRSILPQVKKLGLRGLVIAYQGTVIADIESGKIIKNGGMPYEDVAEICRVLESLNQPINIYSDNLLYTDIEEGNEYLELYEKIVEVKAEHVCGKISDFVEKEKLFCQKVAILVKSEERDELYNTLKERLGSRFDVTCSASVLVEVSPLGDNKGEALKYLADYYNIPLELTVAAGDNLNDLPMILVAGTGVAVGNAAPALKKAATFVSVTNNEGALAQIIEKFGFA